MVTDVGGVYKDAQNAWQGITVFNAIALCEALDIGMSCFPMRLLKKWST